MREMGNERLGELVNERIRKYKYFIWDVTTKCVEGKYTNQEEAYYYARQKGCSVYSINQNGINWLERKQAIEKAEYGE